MTLPDIRHSLHPTFVCILFLYISAVEFTCFMQANTQVDLGSSGIPVYEKIQSVPSAAKRVYDLHLSASIKHDYLK